MTKHRVLLTLEIEVQAVDETKAAYTAAMLEQRLWIDSNLSTDIFISGESELINTEIGAIVKVD